MGHRSADMRPEPRALILISAAEFLCPRNMSRMTRAKAPLRTSGPSNIEGAVIVPMILTATPRTDRGMTRIVSCNTLNAGRDLPPHPWHGTSPRPSAAPRGPRIRSAGRQGPDARTSPVPRSRSSAGSRGPRGCGLRAQIPRSPRPVRLFLSLQGPAQDQSRPSFSSAQAIARFQSTLPQGERHVPARRCGLRR